MTLTDFAIVPTAMLAGGMGMWWALLLLAGVYLWYTLAAE